MIETENISKEEGETRAVWGEKGRRRRETRKGKRKREKLASEGKPNLKESGKSKFPSDGNSSFHREVEDMS